MHGADRRRRPASPARSRGRRRRRASWPSAGRSPAPPPSRADRSGTTCRPAPPRRAGTRSAACARRRSRPRSRAEHLDVGQQMMAEGDRLRRLQVREARHHRVGMRLGLARRARAAAPPAPRRAPSSRSRTYSRKSVATWSLRERAVCSRPAGVADQLLEPALDVHVHVFERARELQACRPRSRPAPGRGPAMIFAGVVLGDDALRRQHGGVRLGGADVLRRQTPCRSRWRRLSPP